MMAGQSPAHIRCPSPPSTPQEMNVDPSPVIPQPVYFAPRMNLEAPRPHYAARNSGYALRSSPLAGPAIAVTRPSIIDDIYELDEKDNNIEADKTRRGATPSRISTLHPTPPPSLRNVSMSRTPSPTRSISDVSVKSSASSATSLSVVYSPPLPSAALPSSRPRPRSLVQPHSQSLPGARTRTSISVPAPFQYSSAASFRPNTSRDPTCNWLTTTAPPTFSRSRVKGVVMPVKASGKRPQTAPAIPRASGFGSEVVSVSPRRSHPHRKEALSPDEARSQYRAMLWGHHPYDFDQPETSYRVGTAIIRKQRRPRSLMALSLRSTLGEVREEHERETESESGGRGDGEPGKDVTASGDKLVFPVLTMKDERESENLYPAAQGRTEKMTGWIKRRFKNSLKVVKGTFMQTGTASTMVAP